MNQESSSWFMSGSDLFGYKKVHYEVMNYDGGPKSQVPTGSFLEKKQIQKSLKHQEDLMSIQRVQKSGALSVTKWDSVSKEVTVLKLQGHALSHAGYRRGQQQLFHPEEALFYLDCGLLEIIDNEIPMSIQEAYEKLLIDACMMQKYQVYSHLTRLGYVAVRHVECRKITDYELKIKLHQPRCSQQEVLELEKKEINLIKNKSKVDFNNNLSDYSDVVFPNYIGHRKFKLKLPEKKFLPPGVDVSQSKLFINISRFSALPINEKKVNKKRKLSSSLGPPSKKCSVDKCSCDYRRWYIEEDHSSSFYTKFRYSDKYIAKFKRVEAANWREFKIKVSNRKMNEISDEIQKIRYGPIKSLLDNSQTDKISSIPSPFKKLESSALSNNGRNLEIVYDVYLPNNKFKKSEYSPPDHRIIVMSIHESIPTLGELLNLSNKYKDGIPFHFAVVGNGKVQFYTQQLISLPNLP